jgi:hypothetical protein
MEVQELRVLIKETMREVLREERLILCKLLMPYVDDVAQAELEAEFGLPSNYAEEETVDMTNWVKHGNQVS